MALGTIKQNILIDVEADTDDAVSNLKKLKRETDSAMSGVMASIKEAISSVGALDGTFARLKSGLGEAMGIVSKFSGALRGYAEDQKLAANTASFDIGRISAAMKGLKTETEIMTQVSQLNRGEQKLTQQQMELVTTAIAGFEKQGLEAGKAVDIVRQAVVQLSTDGLKEMGINVDKTGLDMNRQADRGELLKRVLDSLTVSSRDFANAQLTAGEQAVKAAVKMEDAIDRLQRNARRGAAEAASFIDKASQAFVEQAGGGLAGQIQDNNDQLYRPSQVYANWQTQGTNLGWQAGVDQLKRQFGDTVGGFRGLGGDIGSAFAGAGPVNSNTGSRSAGAVRTVQQALAQLSNALAADVGGATGQLSTSLGAAAGGNADIFGADVTNRFFQEESSRRYSAQDMVNAETQARIEQQRALAESIIGTTSATDIAAQAFGTFSSAAGDAFLNAMTGAESFGTGMKKAFGQAVAGASKMMFVSGIQEAALGLASLALGPLGGVSAAMHFKAAAAFGAGAVVAGAIAGQLGVGGSGASGGASFGGGGASQAAPISTGGASASAPATNTVMIIGDPFDTETNSRRRQANAKRIVERVNGDSAGGSF